MNFKFLSTFALTLALVGSLTFAGCAGGGQQADEGAAAPTETEAVETEAIETEVVETEVPVTEEAMPTEESHGEPMAPAEGHGETEAHGDGEHHAEEAAH